MKRTNLGKVGAEWTHTTAMIRKSASKENFILCWSSSTECDYPLATPPFLKGAKKLPPCVSFATLHLL